MLVGGAGRVQAEGLAHTSPRATPWVSGPFLSLQAIGLLHTGWPSQTFQDEHRVF